MPVVLKIILNIILFIVYAVVFMLLAGAIVAIIDNVAGTSFVANPRLLDGLAFVSIFFLVILSIVAKKYFYIPLESAEEIIVEEEHENL